MYNQAETILLRWRQYAKNSDSIRKIRVNAVRKCNAIVITFPCILRDFHLKSYYCCQRMHLAQAHHNKSGKKIKICKNRNNDNQFIRGIARRLPTPLSVLLLRPHFTLFKSPKLLSRMPPAMNIAVSSSFSIATSCQNCNALVTLHWFTWARLN